MNQEQQEALQQDVNAKRQTLTDGLPEEIEKQFKAVEKAVKTLVDAKVVFYLFPLLPDNTGRQGTWQWNSIGALAEYDQSGNVTENWKQVTSDMNIGLVCSVFHTFVNQSQYAQFSENDKLLMYMEWLKDSLNLKNE